MCKIGEKLSRHDCGKFARSFLKSNFQNRLLYLLNINLRVYFSKILCILIQYILLIKLKIYLTIYYTLLYFCY